MRDATGEARRGGLRVTLIAFGASFAVYLIPLFGPHAFWLLGTYLYVWQLSGAPIEL